VKKSHYIIVPAVVRYDNRLPLGSRLLYGEIKGLTNKHGFCFATNGWFAAKYDVTTVTISSWISKLKEFGYIKVEYEPYRRMFVPKLEENNGKEKNNIETTRNGQLVQD